MCDTCARIKKAMQYCSLRSIPGQEVLIITKKSKELHNILREILSDDLL